MNRCYFIVIVFSCLVLGIDDTQGQWVEVYGPYGGGVQTFAVSGANLFAGTIGAGVFLSTNNGTSWTAVNAGLTDTNIYALAVHGNTLFAGTQDSGIFFSTNNGTNWTTAGPIHPRVRALVASDTNLFAATWGGGVFRSTDNGLNWTAVNAGLTNAYIWCLAIGPNGTGGTNLFAATFESLESYDAAFVSTNNGSNWTQANGDHTLQGLVYALVVRSSGTDATTLYAGTMGGGVNFTVDNGRSWNFMPTGLTNPFVYSLAVKGGDVFAGTYGGGVCRSNIDPARWTAINTGLTNLEIVSLGVNDMYLFAGTNHGVWRRPLSEITGIQEMDHPVPMGYTLEQNYPNPFNPSTNIGYGVPVRSRVRLEVYNMLGQRVALLVDEQKEAGNYVETLHATSLPSGVYFYRLVAGKFSEVKKMLLMK